MSVYRRVVAYYRPFVGSIGGALLLLLLSVGLNLLKPWPVKYLVDNILTNQSGHYHLPLWHGDLTQIEAIGLVALATVVIHLLWGITNLLNNYWLIDIGLRALLRLRTELYAYLQTLPLRYHDHRRSSDSTFRVAYDSQAIQTFFNRGFVSVLGSLLTLIGAFAVMYSFNPMLSFLSLAVIPFLLAAIYYYAARIRRETAQYQQEESEVFSRASEGLTSIRVVHAFSREDYEVREFSREARESLDANLRLSFTSGMSTMAVSVVMAVGTAGLIYFGALEVMAGRMKIGELWVFINYLAMLYQPLEQLSYTAWSLEGAAAGMQRSFEILDAKNDVADKSDARDAKILSGQIDFKEIEFSYQADAPVLRGIDLSIQPGQTVALVGGTGAGKSTILSLIPRFYDPSKGQVLVDGMDVRDIRKQSLRAQIAMVLQDTLLLNTTIYENIAYGRPGATRKEVEEAAKAAQIHDFIIQQPKGYLAEAGERGVKLSGGQRQRIGIARAFLRNAPILLLDEPTSSLDMETEAEIMGALNTLMKKPTTLIVTHRLSTIHHVDRICVLEGGRIVESGTGVELLARKGVYARLWNAANSGNDKS